ncbi:MAG: branched-chain amino acid aminotransferase [Spirochaetota bacterium]
MNTKTADIDWANLPFGYVKTDFNIRYLYSNGKWSKEELTRDEYIPMHIAASCLHYGQEAFEGMKAFETKDGRIVVFRPEANSKRLQKTSRRIFMPEIPEKMFLDAVNKVVLANKKFVPPYGTGASLYIRPLVIGTGAKVGLGPADEYMFIIFVTPVGPYYKGGLTPVKALVVTDFDRAAPNGVGDCKVGGNYAAGLSGGQYGKDLGYPVVLYLDSKEKKYIDEFSTSNFIAIKGNTYITPVSNSILQSITNDSLATVARDKGMKVEKRQINIEEIAEFDEVGAVGTAAVVTPVHLIHYNGKDYTFHKENEAGPVITSLYEAFTGIQKGEVKDSHNWLFEIK